MACTRLMVMVPLLMGVAMSAVPHPRSRRIAFVEMGTDLAEESAQFAPRPSRLANADAEDAAEPSSLEEMNIAEPSNTFAMEVEEQSDHVEVVAPSNLEITNKEAPTNVVEIKQAAPTGVEENEITPSSLLGEMEKNSPSNAKETDIAAPLNFVQMAQAASSNLMQREESAPSNVIQEEKGAPSNIVKMETIPSRLVEVEVSPSRVVETEVASRGDSSAVALVAFRASPSLARQARLVDLGGMAAMAAGPLPRRSPDGAATSIHVRTRTLGLSGCDPKKNCIIKQKNFH